MTATPAEIEAIAPDWLEFVRASEWGIVWKRPPVAERLNDPETYIHHGAGGRNGLDARQAMRTLQTWYHNVKNYSTIAYDVMVHRSVGSERITILGAREGALSAATADRNDLGEAICLFGYFQPGHRLSEQPTDRELEGMAFAVAWSIAHGWSAPDTRVLGHRDNPAHPGATSCPGDHLYRHVPAIGRRALELLELAARPTPPPPSRPSWSEPMTALRMNTSTEPRIVDTRQANGAPVRRLTVDVGDQAATAAIVNLAVVGSSAPGYGVAWAAGTPKPAPASCINYGPNDVVANAILVATTAGRFELELAAPAHVIVDLVGVITP